MSKKAAMTSLAQGLQPQVSCHPAQLALRKATQGSTHWLAYCISAEGAAPKSTQSGSFHTSLAESAMLFEWPEHLNALSRWC